MESMTLLTLTALLLGQLSPAPKIWDHPVRSYFISQFSTMAMTAPRTLTLGDVTLSADAPCFIITNSTRDEWFRVDFTRNHYPPDQCSRPDEAIITMTTKDGKHWHAVWVEDKK